MYEWMPSHHLDNILARHCQEMITLSFMNLRRYGTLLNLLSHCVPLLLCFFLTTAPTFKARRPYQPYTMNFMKRLVSRECYDTLPQKQAPDGMGSNSRERRWWFPFSLYRLKMTLLWFIRALDGLQTLIGYSYLLSCYCYQLTVQLYLLPASLRLLLFNAPHCNKRWMIGCKKGFTQQESLLHIARKSLCTGGLQHRES